MRTAPRTGTRSVSGTVRTANVRPLISANDLAARVAGLGAEIARDYAGKEPVLVCVLKGGFVFAADLARAIDLPLSIEFIRAESYGADTASSGEVRITLEPDALLTGRDVILVEDIVDTGLTAARILEVLRAHKPASLKVCTLLDKPSHRVTDVPLDYTGFVIDDVFVVGKKLAREGHREKYDLLIRC
jgi:hypoxanthine phosphoribosyltransferase